MMRNRFTTTTLLLALGTVCGTTRIAGASHITTEILGGLPVTAQRRSAACDEAVKRAVALLPRQPEKVLVVDAKRALPPVDGHGGKVEAFVTRGEHVVYLVAQGDMLQHALKGPGIFDYALAATICHEMAHIEGANEVEAQRQEEDLWRQFVLERRVDATRGLRYLALLQKRR